MKRLSFACLAIFLVEVLAFSDASALFHSEGTNYYFRNSDTWTIKAFHKEWDEKLGVFENALINRIRQGRAPIVEILPKWDYIGYRYSWRDRNYQCQWDDWTTKVEVDTEYGLSNKQGNPCLSIPALNARKFDVFSPLDLSPSSLFSLRIMEAWYVGPSVLSIIFYCFFPSFLFTSWILQKASLMKRFLLTLPIVVLTCFLVFWDSFDAKDMSGFAPFFDIPSMYIFSAFFFWMAWAFRLMKRDLKIFIRISGYPRLSVWVTNSVVLSVYIWFHHWVGTYPYPAKTWGMAATIAIIVVFVIAKRNGRIPNWLIENESPNVPNNRSQS